MADEYTSIFSPDERGGFLTYPQLEARRRIALALAARNRPYPKTIGEGLSALGEGLGEGYMNANLRREEARQAAQEQRLIGPVLQGGSPAPGPGAAAPAPAIPRTAPAPSSSRTAMNGGDDYDLASLSENLNQADVNAAKQSSTPEGARRSLVMSSATADDTPLTPTQATQQPQMSIEEWLQRIARNESGGSKNPYQLVGERSRSGDYPYGKYQIMGARISEWSKKFLGREITPQEFLAKPELQEQIARGQGSEYVARYGPVGAAGAWFAGPNGMKNANAKDALGTSVIEYRRRFVNPLTSRDQVATAAAGGENGAPYQVASLGDARPNVRDDITNAIVGPAPEASQAPQPEILAQARTPQQQQQFQPRRDVNPAQQMPVTPGTSMPSTEPVPQQDMPQYPHPGPPPPRPDPRIISSQGQQAGALMNDERLSPAGKAKMRTIYEQEEAKRKALEAGDIAIWQRQDTEWNRKMDERLKYDLGARDRQIAQQKARQEVEENQRKQQVEEAFKGMDPKQVETAAQKSREAADAQAAGYRSIMEARRAFTESGVVPVTGAFADQRLAAMKAATLSGVADYSKEIQATEVFRSSMAPVVAAALKATVGSTQISNADREFAEKAAAGAITLDAGSIKRMLDIGQRAQLIALNKHQDMISGLYGKLNPRLGETMFGVDLGLPQDKVQLLIDNPHKKADFDEKYGPGAADYSIRRYEWRRQAGY